MSSFYKIMSTVCMLFYIKNCMMLEINFFFCAIFTLNLLTKYLLFLVGMQPFAECSQ